LSTITLSKDQLELLRLLKGSNKPQPFLGAAVAAGASTAEVAELGKLGLVNATKDLLGDYYLELTNLGMEMVA